MKGFEVICKPPTETFSAI